MIHKTSISHSETGKGDIQGLRPGALAGRTAGIRWGAALLLCLMLAPMASFEQAGPGGKTRPVALHRRPAKPLADACCGWEEASVRPMADIPTYRISLPGRRAFALADLEMTRNHAGPSRDILPAMAPLSVERADVDMEVLFHLSNAQWVTEVVQADADMDLRFRIENLLKPDAGQLIRADQDIYDLFRAAMERA